MKKNFILLISLTLVLCGCSRKPERKPIISLAELMIEKIVQSPNATKDTSETTLRRLIKLRKQDSLFYRALLKEGGSLPYKYFYARRGSCCPCSDGGMSCCTCSKGSAFGAPAEVIAEAKGIDSGESVFMLTKMSAQAQADIKILELKRETIDDMDIFVVPDGTKAGKYTVSLTFKGEAIDDLTFHITIDEEGNIHISDL